MAFEWLMKLNDMVSDPATRIARKLHDVEQQLKGIDIAVKQNAFNKLTNPLQRTTAALELQRLKLQHARGELKNYDKVSSSLVSRFRNVRESLRDWLLILTPIAMGMRFLFNTAQSLAHAIVGPIRALEEAGIGLRTMFGQKVGDQLIQQITELGPRIGRPIGDLLQEAIKFSTAGAPQDWIRPLLMGMADMQAMGKDVGKLGYDLAAGFSRPVADLNEMRRGLTGVLDEALVWKQMAKNIFGVDKGSAVGNLNFLMSKNMLAGSEFSKAVLQVIAQLEGGTLGTKAFERADTTLGGMLDRMEARMEKLFMSIADTKGFQTLKLAMKNLIDVLGDSGTAAMVKDIANAIGAMLEPLTGPTGKKRMEEFFESMTQAIKNMLPLLGVAARWVEGMIGGLSGMRNPNAPHSLGAELSKLSDVTGFRQMLIHKEIEAQDFLNPMGEGAEVPVMGPWKDDSGLSGSRIPDSMKRNLQGHPVSVTVPITVHVDSGLKNQDLLTDEARQEILGRVSEALDQINTQSGEGTAAGTVNP